mmetsp:Transcript_18854/g.36672  ORF Transcript_18854/g.36672 Transcript_18854/m.36672 type:complete len:297 (+) Transcript_18854:28-918(+)
MMAKGLPRNIKETVSQLRESLQKCLSDRNSRMMIEMPYGANFGVEGEKTKETGAIPMGDNPEEGFRSDRELARVVCEMFQGTELESTMVCAFSDQPLAAKAKKKWGDSFKGNVIVFDSKGKKAASKKSKGGGGFGAKPDTTQQPKTSAVPDGTEVLLVVAPKTQQLKQIETISREVGMGCLVILINPRLSELKFESPQQQENLESEFETVFHLQPNPVPTWNGGLLYKSYPDDWTLAIPRKIGPPRVLATSSEQWSVEEMEAVLKGEQDKDDDPAGDIFSGVGDSITNAFGFLKGK